MNPAILAKGDDLKKYDYGWEAMDLEIKFFHWPDFGKDHLVVILGGLIDAGGMKQILRRIADMTLHSPDCEVLIDLRKATCSLTSIDIYILAAEPNVWPLKNKVALVSARDIDQYDQLLLLSSCVSNRGFNVTAFYDLDRALQWLALER
ncbi:MAG TPA: hypothetical protein VGK77_24570 [Candidatus Binatia bacterium]